MIIIMLNIVDGKDEKTGETVTRVGCGVGSKGEISLMEVLAAAGILGKAYPKAMEELAKVVNDDAPRILTPKGAGNILTPR